MLTTSTTSTAAAPATTTPSGDAAAAPAETCACTPPFPTLIATIDGTTRPAIPTTDPSAAETEAYAYCGACGTGYRGHWTLTPIKNPEKVAEKTPPKSAVDLLRLLVAERVGGEVRPQQERMVDLVETAIKNNTHLLVQAGTGTGKSLGYLIPAVMAGERVVVSTATKQLGEQLVADDLPVLANLMPKVGGPRFTYALLKGRNNYLCHARVEELNTLDDQAADHGALDDALFAVPETRESRRPTPDDLKKLNSLLQWAATTQTGDRSEAPAVSEKIWGQVSTDSAGCPGAKACPFGEDCFAETARETARDSQVVVTNHAQVAQDLRSPAPLLGDYQVLVTDEVHELESYLSSAWGLEVAPASMKHHIALALRKLPRGDKQEWVDARETGTKVLADLDALEELLTFTVDPGLKPELPENVLDLLTATGRKLVEIVHAFEMAASGSRVTQQNAAEYKGAAGKVSEAAEAVLAMCLTANDGSQVRWLEAAHSGRGPSLKVAPLWIGPRLMELLADRTLIATSATITVGGSFDSFIRTLALREPITDDDGETHDPRPFDAVDVGTPFDYDKQALLYIPDLSFPAPVGQDRFAHTDAVLTELTALVKAAGGRTLALFTTRRGAENAATHLRAHLTTPVLCQGDAPPSQLIREFKDDEAATLCATMGFWHGVDVPGPSLSMVILDKLPFAPMTDPLMSARSTAVDEAGRRGFDEVYVAGAAVMLAQGTGRLVRTATDKGVVAVLDTRIMTKGYGRTMLRSLPPMRIFRDRTVVESALTRLTGGPATTTTINTTGKTTGAKPAPKPAPRRKAAPRKARTRSLAKQTRGKDPAA